MRREEGSFTNRFLHGSMPRNKTPTINVQDGYRVTWTAPPDPTKDEIVVFMFGGSTLYGIEVPDDLTIASLVAKNLNDQIEGRRVIVRNYGVSGFVIDNEVHLLLKLLAAGERPDVVAFYDGLNETQVKVALGRSHFFIDGFNRKLFQSPKIPEKRAGRTTRHTFSVC